MFVCFTLLTGEQFKYIQDSDPRNEYRRRNKQLTKIRAACENVINLREW